MLNIGYIKQLKEERHMSLAQLASKSGISKAHWSRIFSGKRGGGSKTIAGVLRAFPDADLKLIFLP